MGGTEDAGCWVHGCDEVPQSNFGRLGCFKTRKGNAASAVVVEPEPTAPPALPKAEARL